MADEQEQGNKALQGFKACPALPPGISRCVEKAGQPSLTDKITNVRCPSSVGVTKSFGRKHEPWNMEYPLGAGPHDPDLDRLASPGGHRDLCHNSAAGHRRNLSGYRNRFRKRQI